MKLNLFRTVTMLQKLLKEDLYYPLLGKQKLERVCKTCNQFREILTLDNLRKPCPKCKGTGLEIIEVINYTPQRLLNKVIHVSSGDIYFLDMFGEWVTEVFLSEESCMYACEKLNRRHNV